MRVTWALGAAFFVALTGCGVDEADETSLEASDAIEEWDASDMMLAGDVPSGPHFNLNLIGVPKDKSASNGGDGRRIFVRLEGNTKIQLTEGAFAVLDFNGTDGTASFRLPAPDPDGDGVTTYRVFSRALGKPGGSSRTTTCGTDVATREVVCSLETLVSVRTGGKSRFQDVSKQLLSIVTDLDGDGKLERRPLFDATLQDMFWSYDNAGLKLLQLRFYATNL